MFPLVSLVHGRNTQDEWVRLGLGYIRDQEFFEGRSGLL